MTEKTVRRPSASMVIACIALFAALSGGAYAALSKNSVTSKQIQNGTVAGKDLKPDTLKGKQIKESKLGEVPTAASAGSADSADDAAKIAGVEVVRVQPFTLTNGQSQQIYQRGTLTLTASCSINEGGTTDFARILISTSVDNATFDAEDTTPDLDIGTLATNRDFLQASPATGTPSIDSNSDGSAFAPGGSEIAGADLTAAVNLSQDGVGVCRFFGLVYGV